MNSKSDSDFPRDEDPFVSNSLPLKQWTIALCIFTAGTFVFNEVASGWFGSYVYFIAGTELVWWGLITLIGSIVGAIFYLIWSTISDNLRTRLGRRIPLILAGGLITAGLTVLFIVSDNIVWLLIDGGILMAISRSMLSSGRSLTPDLIPQELRQLDEAALDQALLKLGLQFVIDEPIRYLQLSLSRIPFYFMFWPSNDSGMLSNISRMASFGLMWPFM